MSLFIDFVGLNTLAQDAVSGSIGGENIIGYPSGSPSSSYANPHWRIDNRPEWFNGLMLHRNGPGGNSSFKQVRVHQNPLTRYQNNNNIFTIVEEPSEIINPYLATSQPFVNYISSRYGNILSYKEPPVTDKYRPLNWIFGIDNLSSRIENPTDLAVPTIERVMVNNTYANELGYFVNTSLNNYLGLLEPSDPMYDKVTSFYLSGGIDAADSPVSNFEYLKYGEKVFPREINTYSAEVRSRTTYVNNYWRDSRIQRTQGNVSNGFGSTVSQSMWALDAGESWATKAYVHTGYISSTYMSGAGVLQNQYNMFGMLPSGSMSANVKLRPAPIYTRLHTLSSSLSVMSLSGLWIDETFEGTSPVVPQGVGALFQGTALWEAGSQAGKNPFDTSYDVWAENVRLKGQDFSIIPEYRVHNFIDRFNTLGNNIDIYDVFEMTGGAANAQNSSEENFYKTYSTSDFMKYFGKIKKDHEGFVDPSTIKLSFTAIKKFLAYDSFYPSQRTVDLADQFYASFNDHISSSQAPWAGAPSANPGLQTAAAAMNLYAPLFAPGILYNSIKSGVAVDYPLITGSLIGPYRTYGTHALRDKAQAALLITNPEYEILNDNFDIRIPFEAIISPQAHLVGLELVSNEPNPSGNTDYTCFWAGGGDNLYSEMASNFFAEVADFYLQDAGFTQIQSLEQQDPLFGQLEAGKDYRMRVKMYRTMDGPNLSFDKGDGLYLPPQDMINMATAYTSSDPNIEPPWKVTDGPRETMTMYSRPSAFGPPCFGGNFAVGIPTAPYESAGALNGYNFPFTPPYYHGESWADFKFTPSESRKHSVSEIINGATIDYWRVDQYAWESIWKIPSYPHGPQASDIANGYVNIQNNAMQLSASVNLVGTTNKATSFSFSQGGLLPFVINSADDPGDTRWVIQPRFESPILNFNNASLTTASANLFTAQTPRGMWHQYGEVPQGDTGIFLEVAEVPESWINNRLDDNASNNRSLANAVGMSRTPQRLGEIANSKLISEAVVAVPFIEIQGEKRFFEFTRESINLAMNKIISIAQDSPLPTIGSARVAAGVSNDVGFSILDMVRKIGTYNFPPNFDFIRDQTMKPFAMYIFEFSHVLNKQDLADIWQGLPPSIASEMVESQASISHPLLAKELLGGGHPGDETRTGGFLPSKIKWMVFKVKRRAKKNYSSKIASGDASEVVSSTRQHETYNWPYDYFSLVELGKLDVEFTYSNITVAGNTTINDPIGYERVGQETRELSEPTQYSSGLDNIYQENKKDMVGIMKAKQALGTGQVLYEETAAQVNAFYQATQNVIDLNEVTITVIPPPNLPKYP